MRKFQSKKEVLKAGLKSLPVRLGVAAGAATLAASSFAAEGDIDVSGVVTQLTSGVVAVTAVCTAALGVVVVVKLFKYVRTAM